MATFEDAASLAADPVFQAKIIACASNVATEIGEAVLAMDSPSGIDKARLVFAQDVLGDPISWTTSWAWAVAVQGGIDGTSSDLDLRFQVELLWNLLAKVPV